VSQRKCLAPGAGHTYGDRVHRGRGRPGGGIHLAPALSASAHIWSGGATEQDGPRKEMGTGQVRNLHAFPRWKVLGSTRPLTAATGDYVMSLGFLPIGDQSTPDHADVRYRLSELIEMLDLQQMAAAMELEKMLKDSHDDVFQEVRRYAELLTQLDPANCNAAQEIGEVVLRLSYARTPRERLDALTNEARRLKKAVAEARRQGCVRTLSAAVAIASIGMAGIWVATYLLA
jgi:hypothetical protein